MSSNFILNYTAAQFKKLYLKQQKQLYYKYIILTKFEYLKYF